MHQDKKVRKGHFDSDFTLEELLGGLPQGKLAQGLAQLLGQRFRLLATGDKVLLGAPQPLSGACRFELRLDIEPLGFLEAPASMEIQARACTLMIELLLQSAARYLMASQLHEDNVSESFQRLQQEHAALLKSQLSYKQLVGELDARVQAQVKTIHHTELQLYEAEKMASIGQLAAGVAHEINNPMGFIRSNLGTAKVYVQKLNSLAPLVRDGGGGRLKAAWQAGDMDFVMEDFAALLDESIAGADRVARIVADLKTFSDVDRAGEELCNINDSVVSVCNIASSRIPAGVHLSMELDDSPSLRCRPGRLNQALLNLLLNALQAVGQQGEIRLKTEYGDGEILVHVIDSGEGIPKERLSRIFEPFFTTRPVGQGTGLGLTVCRDIVQAHGGSISVESKVGVGSHFTVHLPLGRMES